MNEKRNWPRTEEQEVEFELLKERVQAIAKTLDKMLLTQMVEERAKQERKDAITTVLKAVAMTFFILLAGVGFFTILNILFG